MPVMGVGTWQMDNVPGTIITALDLGYRLIDTSSDYGTQPGIARGLAESGVNRDQVFVVTKVEETDEAYERTVSNLKELNLDYIDLTLIHRPPPRGPGEKLWKGLLRAQRDGLTRHIGVSNYSRDLLEQLAAGGTMPAVNQVEWSPFGHSMDLLDYCRRNDIILMAYSPLTRTTRLDDPTLVEIASGYGKTPAQLLIRWNLQLGTCPIPKADSLSHLTENRDVFDFAITNRDMESLNDLNEHFSSIGSLQYVSTAR